MGTPGLFAEAVDRIGGEPIPARMARKAPIRHLDPLLLLVTLALTAYGALMIYYATKPKQEAADLDPAIFLKRQVFFLAAGTIILLLTSMVDYRQLRAFSWLIYGAVLIGLGIVLSPLGEVVQGARRWISLGAFQIQPSELSKIAIILVVAGYLSQRKGAVNTFHVLVGLVIVAIPCVLIYLEPDLGSMLMLVAIFMLMLIVGGGRVRHFLLLIALGAAGLITVLQLGLLQDYQVSRLTAFLDPNPDVQSEAYNLHQSKIAIGSGGMRGNGLDKELSQTSLDYVPEQHTDFIFTAVGEQLGFVGSAVLLGLFSFLIWRALRIAAIAADLFGTLVAAGIAAYWSVQLFVNVGMTMGIMPITGIPLPFISYGGSSLLTNFLAVGLLLNIHMRRFL